MPDMPSIRSATAALILALALLQACNADDPPATVAVQTHFSESSGLTVVGSDGHSQQLLEGSLAARSVVSPTGRWILVEDMQLSNLVVIRAFRRTNGHYDEIALPGIRAHWEAMAADAGIGFEDLVNPRVGIEGFGEAGRSVLLRFTADTGLAESPELDALAEIVLPEAPD